MGLVKDPGMALSMIEAIVTSNSIPKFPKNDYDNVLAEIYQGQRPLQLALYYGIPKSDVPEDPEESSELTESEKETVGMQLEGCGFYVPDEQLEKMFRQFALGPHAQVTRINPSTKTEIFIDYRTDGFPECFYIEVSDGASKTPILPPLCLAFFKGQDAEAKNYLCSAAKLLQEKGMKVSLVERL